jgi:hypothetical protein
VPALERLRGLRVVADPAALDDARWSSDDVLVLRLAPDDALAIGATVVALDDDHAIVEDERGYVGAWCDAAAIAEHAEWSLPTARPALAQGAIAGVPAKVWLPGGADDGPERAFIVVTNAASATLAERLGWGRP